MTNISTIYLRLSSPHGDPFRRKLGLDLLPVLSPVPETLDGGEWGTFRVFYIDSARLSAAQTEQLIEWITCEGDNPDTEAVRQNVLSNKATYSLVDDDQSKIVLHDPMAWG